MRVGRVEPTLTRNITQVQNTTAGKKVNCNMLRDFFRRIHIRTLVLREESGQTMAEYGVVLSVITIAAVAAFLALGGKINDVVTAVTNVLKTG